MRRLTVLTVLVSLCCTATSARNRVRRDVPGARHVPKHATTGAACTDRARFTILRNVKTENTFRELTHGMHELIGLLGYPVRTLPFPDCLSSQDVEARCTPQAASSHKIDIFIVDSFCFDETMVSMPEPAIIWQLEVLPGTQRGCLTNPRMMTMLQRNVVWDYSYINIDHLRAALGRRVRARWMPLLWVPGVPVMADGSRSVAEDIDVLFLGSINGRRRVVLDTLKSRGLNVVAVDSAFDRTRDNLLMRSKVVVNIHFYDAGLLETYRLWTVGAMRRFVVSEDTPDTRVQSRFEGSVVFAPYNSIADTVVEWLHRPHSLRAAIGNALYNHIVHSNTADLYAKSLREAVAFYSGKACT